MLSKEPLVLRKPILELTLHYPPQLVAGDTDFAVISKLTYEGVSPCTDGAAARPITFHTAFFFAPPAFRLYRLRRGGNGKGESEGEANQWEECDDDDEAGFIIVEAPPESINISRHEHFAGLRLGESWELRHLGRKSMTGNRLPGDIAAGDRFKFQFCGAEVDWWDWGSREEDHAETYVYLPCFIMGPVLQTPPSSATTSDVCPWSDNGGRPKFKFGPSEVEFSVVTSM